MATAWLLRLGGKAKRKERGAKSKTRNLSIHHVSSRLASLNHFIRSHQHVWRDRQKKSLLNARGF